MLMEPNVILIVCDTLRKDILRAYGGEAKTPNIDKFVKESVVYENCVAPAPWTFPSHVSLFTGLYPSEHGIHETREMKTEKLMELNKRFQKERLAEYMSKQGYQTIGISNNIGVSRYTGFDKGFDTFLNVETTPWKSPLALEARFMGSDAIQVASELIKRNRAGEILKFGKELMRITAFSKAINYPMHKGVELTSSLIMNLKINQKFFLFLNFMEMHEPYKGYNEKETQDNLTGLKAISESRAKYMKERYVEECEFFDRGFGELIDILKMRGLYDDSLIIVTSDHGQAFNEHGFMYHGIYLYDEITGIPLMIKYPNGKKFKKSSGYQSLTNIFALIKSVLKGGDDKVLSNKIVFSEAFGNTERPTDSYMHRLPYLNATYEKVRRAVFKDGYKLTYNKTDQKVEEFMKNGKEISTNANKKILNELLHQLGVK